MLTRLSRHGTRWFDLRVERAVPNREGEDAFSLDLTLSPSTLTPKLSWSRVRTFYETNVVPACRGLMSVLEVDVEHVARLLAELDPLPHETGEQVQGVDLSLSTSISPCSITQSALTAGPFVLSDTVSTDRPKRKRRRSSVLHGPIVLLPSASSAPTIIITPCPSQPRETSCWVPIQDAAFGSRLTVPTHAVLNSVHPPMILPATTVRTRVKDWEYANGHWNAIIPSPDEQCRKGMFSRTSNPRKIRRPPSP